jgi:hypothetical protein
MSVRQPIGKPRWRTFLLAAMLAVSPILVTTAPADAAFTCAKTEKIGTPAVAYCRVPLTDLIAGKIPTGSKIVVNGHVEGATGKIVKVGTLVSDCQPGHICGATLSWVYTTIDFSRLSTLPPKNWWTDMYGTSKGTTMTPDAWVKIRFEDPNFS